MGIADGQIKSIKKTPLNADKIIDIKGKLILPGLIDAHVHFRDPGLTYKENFKTGSQAAANGGFTTVMDMPNTVPPTNTAKNFKSKKEIAFKKSIVDFALHAGVGELDEIEKIAPLNPASFKVFMDLSDDYYLAGVFERVSSLPRDMIITLHAENRDIVNHSTKKLKSENKNSAEDYTLARPALAEEISVSQALGLSLHFNNHIHLCHVSTARSLRLISYFKELGCRVTSEVTPHHLFLDSIAFEKWGNIAKTNPPLRSNLDNIPFSKLGIVDIMATDHAPHTLEEKDRGVWKSSPGIPNLEIVLPLLLSRFNRGQISIGHIITLLCENPSRIFNLNNKGFIKEGMDADLVVVDLKVEGKINPDNFYTKANYSPFSGFEYKGAPIMTLSHGNVVMEEGQVTENQGRYVYPD